MEMTSAESGCRPLTLGDSDLLLYQPDYKLLICRACKYGVQKSAVGSHLLRQHKIYRGERQRLLDIVAQLELLEARDTLLPRPGTRAIDGLPVLFGLSCSIPGCGHLTVSVKRMQRHWSGQHGPQHGLGKFVPSLASFTRPAKLQTFFRGTKVKYFEVTSPTAPYARTFDGVSTPSLGDDAMQQGEADGIVRIAPTSPHSVTQSPLSESDMQTLTYLHHFSSSTTHTLPLSKAAGHDTKDVITTALEHPWLMCGVLAIAAHHTDQWSTSVDDASKHRERAVGYSSSFSAGLAQSHGLHSDGSSRPPEAAELIGTELNCIVRCLQFAKDANVVEEAPVDASSIPALLASMRAFAGLRYATHNGGSDGSSSRADSAPRPNDTPLVNSVPSSSVGDQISSPLLELIASLPTAMMDALGKPDNVQDVFAILTAVSRLSDSFELAFMSTQLDAAWHGVISWVGGLPERFHQLLLRHDAAALVVVAHWAAIVIRRADVAGCWYVQGLSQAIVVQVLDQLAQADSRLLDLVKWLMSHLSD